MPPPAGKQEACELLLTRSPFKEEICYTEGSPVHLFKEEEDPLPIKRAEKGLESRTLQFCAARLKGPVATRSG